jgi:DNA repair photolyase
MIPRPLVIGSTMSYTKLSIKGRGASANPPNRFELITLEPVGESTAPGEIPPPPTQYFQDSTRTIIARNNSPDVGFEFSINPYRGCEHGCIYCYARPTHEYLGLSAGLDFETKIFVKLDAPQLLRKELANQGWQPKTIAISGVTDCYQPVERKLQLTRQCLEVLAEFGNPVSLITKNQLITRDLDILGEMARRRGVIAILSVTTLDPELGRLMEPRTSSPPQRLEAVRMLAAAGVPVGVMVAPVIPGLTDHEIPRILQASAEAGAQFAGYVPLRLPYAISDLFSDWLGRHFPDRREKVLNRIRSMRLGKLNDSAFHTRMRGHGPFADQMKKMFDLARRRTGLDRPGPELTTEHFRRCHDQPCLFQH